MIGQFHRTASGRASFEIYEASDEMVFHLVDIVQAHFGFTSRLPVWTDEEIYIDCRRSDTNITIGWDQWSGCFVMACTEFADEVVLQIGDYLNSTFTGPGPQ